MRAVVLVRQRSVERTEPEVHLVPLPLRGEAGRRDAVRALCGWRLRADHLETVRPGTGRWCTNCFVVHVIGNPSSPAPSTPALAQCPGATDPGTADPAAAGHGMTGSGATGADPVAGRLTVGVAYQRLGWPVTLRRDQVALNLDLDVDAVALVIPAVLATEVAEILIRRRCPPPMLAHPAIPTHRVIVAGERYPVPLGWPTGVHRVTGTLLLPPTVTTEGPIYWVRPPQPDALRLCREIDVIAALRAALSNS